MSDIRVNFVHENAIYMFIEYVVMQKYNLQFMMVTIFRLCSGHHQIMHYLEFKKTIESS